MLPAIHLHGDGIAAACCARLLDRAGYKPSISATNRPMIPFVVVSKSTQTLLGDVFGNDNLFRDAYPIHKRIVLWGSQSNPLVVPHQAAVISEKDLVDRAWRGAPFGSQLPTASLDWQVVSAPPLPLETTQHHFGSRVAFTAGVDLKPDAEQQACWVESLHEGWLFLLNIGNGCGSLISVGAPPNVLLARSRLIGDQIGRLENQSAQFPAYPRILAEVYGPRWIACGTAAMAFDPLCGDGTGNSVREAILASAVLEAILRGFAANSVLAHYSWRLRAGFLRHLELCLSFYRQARSGPWWDMEISLLQQGIEWIRNQVAGSGLPRYRLIDFELKEIDASC